MVTFCRTKYSYVYPDIEKYFQLPIINYRDWPQHTHVRSLYGEVWGPQLFKMVDIIYIFCHV
jgi:hypothetical protein